MRRRVVFDRWLMGFRRRIAVWRVVPMARREAGLWSTSERAALMREMERVG